MDFTQHIAQYIKKTALLPERSRVVVALSGGADSVALLCVLHELHYDLIAAHCNFHLRGEESDRDETFVRKLTCEKGIACRFASFDTVQYAKTHGCSIEMAARELRYEWFEQIRDEEQADAIAVAHHADDSVETILLNIIRGTGIHGLAGISDKRAYVVRPLLDVTRTDILLYLQMKEETYVTDSTNLQDEYIRNKIRLNILPLMREINPSINETVLRMAENLGETIDFTDRFLEKEMAENGMNEGTCSIARLQESPMPHTLLYRWLSKSHFNRVQCEQVYATLQHDQSKLFYSSTHRLFKERGFLHLAGPRETIESVTIDDCAGTVVYGGVEKRQCLRCNLYEVREDRPLCKDNFSITVDADKLEYPLIWRSWHADDRFRPLGMNGSKSVKDYLSDRKYASWEKEKATVLCTGNRIVWLVGERLDHRFRVTSETVRVCEIVLE